MEASVDNEVIIETVGSVDVSVANATDVVVVDDSALDITVTKKEYKIVGDEVYIAKLYDDAPQWMKDLVQLVVDNTMETESVALRNDLIGHLNQFATSYVPLNQYTQSILDLSNADTSMHATLETLNSNFNDGLDTANSQIINLQSTKASKTEVATKVIETLAAQLTTPTSELGATIGNLQQAIVTGDSANADSITTLMSSLEGEVDARATATQYLNTYVGITEGGAATGTGMLAQIEILNKQNDGVIETYTGTYDVMLNAAASPTDDDELVITAEPYATWKANELVGSLDIRLAHIGDVYIKYETTTTGAKSYIGSYKFIKTAPDETSPYSSDPDGFTWALVIDQAAQDAYVAALNAWDLADDKRRVFVGLGATTTPSVPYDQGDLWLIDTARVVNSISCKVGDILRCIETKGSLATYEQNDWVLASSYAAAVQAEADALEIWKNTTYSTFVSDIQSQVDKKAETFYQSSVPTGRITSINVPANATLDKYVGDIWKNTYIGTIGGYLGNNTEYVYTKTANGSNWDYKWTKMEVPDVVFDTIDTKKSIYSGNTVPTGAVERDIWIPSADVNITTSGMCTVAGGTWNGTVCSITKYLKGEIYQYLTSKWPLATKYSADIASVSSNLQTQLDGKVDTYYQATVPTGMLATNNGDYWYCTADVSTYKKGKVYKYVHATTSWAETADVSRYAFDTADGKASIFTSAALPNVYKINDLLIVHADNAVGAYAAGVVLTATATRTTGSFTATEWAKKINDTEDLDAFISAIDPKVDTLQNQVDGKIEYFFFTTYNQAGTVVAGSANEAAALVKVKAPWATTAAREQANGNVVYFKDSTHGYWYSSATDGWLALADTSMMQALKKAEDARTVADEKIAAYFALEQSTAPAAPGTVLDTISGKSILVPYYWYDTATSTLKAYSSGWIAVSLSAANNGDQLQAMVVNTVSNTIDYYLYEYNSSATPKWVVRTPTGYVANSTWGVNLATELGSGTTTWAAADSTLENSLHTEIGNEGARVESKFAYNSALTINGTTYNSGFGLSNSAGTGAGSEFWIDASRFKFTNSAKTGSTAPFTIDASGTTPQITFNGKVSFSNVTGTPTHTSGLLANRPAAPVAGSTYTATDQDNQIYTYTNVGWIAGGDPDALTAADLGASGTTVIDGGRITTGTVNAARLNVNDIFSKNITYTGVITGGNAAGGGIIQSYNGGMVIDLVNGSIYIA